MAGRQRNSDQTLKIISYVIAFVTILVLILSNTYLISKSLVYKKLNENYKANIDENAVLLKNDIVSLEEEIDQLKQIDETIKTTKSEYFHNIKLLEDKIINKETDVKIAYLTFDDGPYYKTYDYLKLLKKYNVKATFFTIGLGKEHCYDKGSENCIPLYKAIVDNDNTIANHTYSHLIFDGLYNSTQSFMAQVKRQEKLIFDETGVTTNIIRFPGGSMTAGYLKNGIIAELRKNNYGWVDWSAADGDGGWVGDVETAWNNIKPTINENIEVILLHDYSSVSYNLLPKLIEYLRENNYLILPLSYESNKVNK